MKILVIGGTGTLGEPAVRALVGSGHTVSATARGVDKARRVSQAGARPLDIDIFDVTALREAMRGTDAVIRLTTKIPTKFSKMRSKEAWAETNRLRDEGTRVAADAALAENVGLLVAESFFGVYADAGDAWVHEDSPVDGSVDTMKAALNGEAQAMRVAQAGGRTAVLRFGGFYASTIPWTIDMLEMARKRSLPQIGRGNFYVPPLHLDDAVSAIVRSLGAPSGIYNVCDDEPLRWKTYVGEVAAAVDAPAPVHLPEFLGPILIGYPWKWITRSVRASNASFKRAVGWAPCVPNMRAGLADLVGVRMSL